MRAIWIALLAGLVLSTPTPALAHSGVTGTEPAAGSTVETLKQTCVTFTEPVFAQAAAMSVAGPGHPVSGLEPHGRVQSAKLSADRRTACVEIAPAAAGQYEITWQATAADGHIQSGTYGFTVSGAAGTPTQTAVVVQPDPIPATAGAQTPAGTTAPTGFLGLSRTQLFLYGTAIFGLVLAVWGTRRRVSRERDDD